MHLAYFDESTTSGQIAIFGAVVVPSGAWGWTERLHGIAIEQLFDVNEWGFRTMPISVPGHADHPFRDDGDHDSGMMPITRSGLIPIS